MDSLELRTHTCGLGRGPTDKFVQFRPVLHFVFLAGALLVGHKAAFWKDLLRTWHVEVAVLLGMAA